MKKLTLSLLALLCATLCAAQTKLCSVYTDNMVLQQNAQVPIWGTSAPMQQVTIIASWNTKDTIRTISDNMGEWRAVLKTPKADLAAHTIRCNDLKISNVMLGEVWLCSGQSNMEWNVNRGILNGEQEAAAATYPYIRICRVPLRASNTPQNLVDVKWESCTPEIMRATSAVGFFFARSLYKELNVPIGIISSAWGGTPAEVWIPEEFFTPDMLKNAVTETNNWRPNKPAKAYNQMIHPLVPFTLAGVIWYQGESNRVWAAHYDNLMKVLIGSWRKLFGNAKLPFYFVQIAPFNYAQNKDTYAAELREAQQKTADELANTGMVVVSDLVDDVRNIHPINKQDVGARLSKFALAEVYGKDVKDYKSPTFRSMTVRSDRALITFNNPTARLICTGSKIEGFVIAGADGVFVPADAKIVGNQIEVWAKGIEKPTQVRYCFDDTTCGNLKTEAGLPVAPFRSK